LIAFGMAVALIDVAPCWDQAPC